jgi:hypothetical protein
MGKLDAQVIEIMGRNRLTNELLAAHIEVAEPIRDRGVDLIAYIDTAGDEITEFRAVPLQLKAASNRSFSINRKYEKFPNLLMVFVWGLQAPREDAVTYALTHHECIAIADQLGWTQSNTWHNRGTYSTTKPSKELLHLLEPYRMTPEKWRGRLMTIQQNNIEAFDNSTRYAGKEILKDSLRSVGIQFTEAIQKPADIVIFSDAASPDRRPLQIPVKVYTGQKRVFRLTKTLETLDRLLIVYVWGVNTESNSNIYASTYREVVDIANEKGYTATSSWRDHGHYSVTDAGEELRELLEPYHIPPQTWQDRIEAALK